MGKITIDRTGSGYVSSNHFPDFSNLEEVTVANDQDNWVLSNINTTQGYRITATNDVDITGITRPNPVVQKSILIYNELPQGKHIKLKKEDTDSSAVNRFILPDDSDYTIDEGACVWLTYIPALNRWIITGGEDKD